MAPRIPSRKRSGLITFPSSVSFTWRNAATDYVLAQIFTRPRGFPHSSLILLLAARVRPSSMCREGNTARNMRLLSQSENQSHLLRKVLIKCEYNFHSRCSFRRKFGADEEGASKREGLPSRRVFIRASSVQS